MSSAKHAHGVSHLVCAQVLGFSLQKSKATSRSNWAAKTLTMHQIKYAALDVFATAQVSTPACLDRQAYMQPAGVKTIPSRGLRIKGAGCK